MLRNNTLPRRKGKEIKDNSLYITISWDEVTAMPKWDLENLTLEQTIMLQDIFAKKKKWEEMKRG